MKEQLKKKFPLRSGDYWIIGLVLMLSAITLIGTFWQKSEKTYCIITQNNVIIKQMELYSDTSETIILEGDYHTEIRIQEHSVWVSSSTCPNQLCVHSGKISKSGQSIVCLPNQVLIQIVSQKPQEVDVIAR